MAVILEIIVLAWCLAVAFFVASRVVRTAFQFVIGGESF